MINSFIVAVSVMDWMKRRPLTAIDQVITALGVSRLMIQASAMTNMFLKLFYQRKFVLKVLLQCLCFILVSFSYLCIYLSALLSAVLCLKICTFRNAVFQSLKKQVVQRVVYLILGIAFISLLLSSPTVYEDKATKNVTYSERTAYEYELSLPFTCYLIFGNIIPFFVQLLSFVLLLVFLHLHLRRMKSRNTLTSWHQFIKP